MVSSLALTEAAEAALWATHKLRVLRSLELGLEGYMMQSYQRMEARFTLALRKNVPELREASPAAASSDWIDSLAFEEDMYGGTFEAFAARSMLAGSAWAIREMHLPAAFRLPFPRAQEYLGRYGADMVTRISDTTRAEMRDVLFRSRNQGWSYDKLAQVLIEKWQQLRKPQPQQHIRSRAHLIAVNETANAYEWGNEIARNGVENLGLVVEKSWLMVGDDRTCMICLGNSTSGWFANQASFPSGHTRAPAHPACRCTVVTRVDLPLT